MGLTLLSASGELASPSGSIGWLAVERTDNSSARSGENISAIDVRRILRARRLRDEFFGRDLFADPAWDIMLDLFAAGLERHEVSVSKTCHAAGVPPTTALRWIGALVDRGLVVRQADGRDRRRIYIRLTDKAADQLTAYFDRARRGQAELLF